MAGDASTRPTKIENSDRKIRVYGDTAVETGVNKVTYLRGSKSEVRQSRYTVVWRKENGTWKKAVYQSTSLSQLPAEAYNR